MKNRLRFLALAAVVSISVAASPAFHFGLKSSLPEAGSTVEAPSEIRLTFTQEPQEGTTSIRLVEAEDAGVTVADVVQDEEDPMSFSVALEGELPPGSYTVSWRGMGADGHVIRDAFNFDVAAK